MDSQLYDPYDPRVHENPFSIYRELRDQHPVYFNSEKNFWALSRFGDVMSAVNDAETFSSADGITIEGGGNLLPMMIMMDPPKHDRLRGIVNRAFTPRRIAELEPRIRKLAAGLIDEFAATGGGDLVDAVASPIPSLIIAEFLGVPGEDRDKFRKWSDAAVRQDPSVPGTQKEGAESARALYEYFGQVIEERRKSPQDDLVTALIQAEVDGEHLAPDELLGFCFLLLVAGNETTTNLISNGAIAFAEHPDQRRDLVTDPTLLPNAVEECLRYDGPVQGLARTTTREIEIHDQKLKAGEKVLLLYGAANRDERQFENPDVFDIRRKAIRHLALGQGTHFCLGASLARMEARVAFDELLKRMPEYGLVAGGREYLHSGPIRGLDRLEIEFAPS